MLAGLRWWVASFFREHTGCSSGVPPALGEAVKPADFDSRSGESRYHIVIQTPLCRLLVTDKPRPMRRRFNVLLRRALTLRPVFGRGSRKSSDGQKVLDELARCWRKRLQVANSAQLDQVTLLRIADEQSIASPKVVERSEALAGLLRWDTTQKTNGPRGQSEAINERRHYEGPNRSSKRSSKKPCGQGSMNSPSSSSRS
jgi:hypothetical protein